MSDNAKKEVSAEAETVENAGIYIHEFKKPFTWDGKEYETLTFDFASLTGADVLKIIDEQTMLGTAVAPVRQFDANFQLGTAIRACAEKLGRDAYLSMPMGDFNRILDRARGFLLEQGF